jgi:hypothetical protein
LEIALHEINMKSLSMNPRDQQHHEAAVPITTLFKCISDSAGIEQSGRVLHFVGTGDSGYATLYDVETSP